ncbi:uncharacterized protein LOC143284957 [Babylonia areolata]|uniref:uncharacterized protein LOC143284957 n=1 Tax=Babylonia areolata TaxID=304850 RepID=UPI003FD518BF
MRHHVRRVLDPGVIMVGYPLGRWLLRRRVCADGYYGSPSCRPCGKCATNTICDKTTGECSSCQPGFDYAADRKCLQECADGKHGTGCSQTCGKCAQGAACDKATGYCPAGCDPGYNPSDRQCNTECADGTYGTGCSQTCGKCAQRAACDKATGYCPAGCDPGYNPSDRQCNTDCPTTKWGQSCNRTCSANCKSTGSRTCDKIDGTCECKPGYTTNSLCEESCADGNWGLDCGRVCSLNCNGLCDKSNGHCPCKPGFLQPTCVSECPDGRYGQNCAYLCGFCHGEQATCHHVSGNCSRCADNREMPLCKDCIAGHWGPTCGQRCGQCGGDGSCDPLSGTCVSLRCLDGWTSTSCDVKCEEGFYGPNCSLRCGNCLNGSPCRPDNGICEQDCDDDHTGVLCQTEKESLVGPIVGSVLGAAVLISITIVGVVCFTKWFSAKKPEPPSRDFMDMTQHSEGVSDQRVLVGQRDSVVYQNLGTGTSIHNYDRTNFNHRDSHHNYSRYSPGSSPGQPTAQSRVAHTYQNTAVDPTADEGTTGAEGGRERNRGGNRAAPEGTYGNVDDPPPAESPYGNVRSVHQGVYGNVSR